MIFDGFAAAIFSRTSLPISWDVASMTVMSLPWTLSLAQGPTPLSFFSSIPIGVKMKVGVMFIARSVQ